MGYECDLFFQAMSDVDMERLRQYDVVGIGSLTNAIPEAYQMADSLRGRGPVVVMGGPHVTFMPEEAAAHCDYVVVGEGESAFPALVAAIENGESPSTIPGLAYRGPGVITCHTASSGAVDFANLPSPDFSLSRQIKHGRTPPIITTSRGCPHNCSFCSVSKVFGRGYRFKRTEQIIKEIRQVINRSVCFGDDNFAGNPARAKALLRDMIAQNAVPLRWCAQMTVSAAMDEELARLMQKTRCRIIYIGIESIATQTLKDFGKAHNFEDIGKCIENLHRHNIGIHGMFVMGIDDTVETARKIVDYAVATDIDSIQILALTPLPGTSAYEEFQGRLLHREWQYFDGIHVVTQPRTCSAYEIQMAMVREMNRFYSLGRVFGGYRRGRGWRVKYRAGGHYLTKKWAKENADYIERLRTGFYRSSGEGIKLDGEVRAAGGHAG
jgi:radical SAM superfamily enzyme YgiQ (UPF0313 family)